MITVWPSSDLFELMESLKIIKRRGEDIRLSPVFKEFVEGLDYQKVNLFIEQMFKEGVFPKTEMKEIRLVNFFMVVMRLWDSSLTENETQAAAIFLSAFSLDVDWEILTVLKEEGR